MCVYMCMYIYIYILYKPSSYCTHPFSTTIVLHTLYDSCCITHRHALYDDNCTTYSIRQLLHSSVLYVNCSTNYRGTIIIILIIIIIMIIIMISIMISSSSIIISIVMILIIRHWISKYESE